MKQERKSIRRFTCWPSFVLVYLKPQKKTQSSFLIFNDCLTLSSLNILKMTDGLALRADKL